MNNLISFGKSHQNDPLDALQDASAMIDTLSTFLEATTGLHAFQERGNMHGLCVILDSCRDTINRAGEALNAERQETHTEMESLAAKAAAVDPVRERFPEVAKLADRMAAVSLRLVRGQRLGDIDTRDAVENIARQCNERAEAQAQPSRPNAALVLA